MKPLAMKNWFARAGKILIIGMLCGAVGGVGGYIALSYAAEINLGGVEDYHIPYQGHLELSGFPVEGITDFTFILYKNENGQAPADKLWTSAPRQLQVSSGYFATVLGDGNDAQNGPDGRLKRAVMEAPALYVGMVVDGVELNGRQRILAVPYAQAPSPDKAGFGVPIGGIVYWYPPATNSQIPAGYAVCDGTNGTPNLINRFVRGTSNLTTARNPAVNGSDTHTHSVSITTSSNGSHSHTQTGGDAKATHTGNGGWFVAEKLKNTGSVGNHSHTVSGNTGSVSTLPTHLSLVPLMRKF